MNIKEKAVGSKWMVSSAHPLATKAGIKVLESEGNAFDAAIAVASTLNVVEPFMSGMGGIGVALLHLAKTNEVKVLDFSGKTPSNTHLSLFKDPTIQDKCNPKNVGTSGPKTALIPGNLAGWYEIHKKYGTKPWASLFKDAINHATNGYKVTPFAEQIMLGASDRLSQMGSISQLSDENSQLPKTGSKIYAHKLTESFQKVSEFGPKVFYEGEIAEKIAVGCKENGGQINIEDLGRYRPEWKETIHIIYKDHIIYGAPPNSTAFQILQTLKLLELLEIGQLSEESPDFLHLFLESAKLAVSDRIEYAGDPIRNPVPIDKLISEIYLKGQLKRINPNKASSSPGDRFLSHRPAETLQPGEFDGGSTTHFTVADKDGNVINITQTLGGTFGSCFAPSDTGIFLNNMCYWFDLEEGSPNVIGPDKQVDFCCSPIQIFRNDKFYASIGTPGSWGIMQTTPQIISNIIDRGLDIQSAIERPRIKSIIGKEVQSEDRFPQETFNRLSEMGHEITKMGKFYYSLGGAQGIIRDPETNEYSGGADPRRDGYAEGA